MVAIFWDTNRERRCGMKVTCECCKNEVSVEPYFYDQRIDNVQFIPSDPLEYRAHVKAKAICPLCGADIRKEYRKLISGNNIVRLAVGEGVE